MGNDKPKSLFLYRVPAYNDISYINLYASAVAEYLFKYYAIRIFETILKPKNISHPNITKINLIAKDNFLNYY